jgi:hypothetical protein
VVDTVKITVPVVVPELSVTVELLELTLQEGRSVAPDGYVVSPQLGVTVPT